MSALVVHFLTGLSNASSLFLIASGLSLIFGVTRILNFAHGSFYMLGAYIAFSTVSYLGNTVLGFWGAVLFAALVVGLIGVVMERLVLRRLYRSSELFHLVATFGFVLIIQDVTLFIWGPQDMLGPRAAGLDGTVNIGGSLLPEYDIALIVLGPLVLLGLTLLFGRTRWGMLVRAAIQDREMLGALGHNQARIFASVFFLGSFLAGLGGAVQIPREPVSLLMDMSIIVEAFVVVVIGGMGSILGAFLAAVIIGELEAFGVLVFPEGTLVLMYLIMVVVLIVRPWGLLGKPIDAGHHSTAPAAFALPGGLHRLMTAVVLGLLGLLPLLGDEFTLVLTTDILIFALFAASLHFIMAGGGMVSFGHAAYFGLGAYAAALLVVNLDTPMALALALAPLAAGLGALVFGWFCVRLSDVYLAMLSLAFAQIVWSVVFQWYQVTGGDDGLIGIWPPMWASDRTVFYYLTLVISAGGVLALRRMLFTPFGYALRAGRDSPRRAEAMGIDVRRQQWFAFTLAGAFAGIAGGLYVFAKGSVFPTAVSIPTSVDALLMVMLGGIETLAGPLVGALVLVGLEDELSRLSWWRLLLGTLIVLICVALPQGIVGSLRDLFANRRIRS